MLTKRGERKTREQAPSKATKKMKRTLLYTYFTMLASLVLCCAMFLGTTMAWFSSDVTTGANVIQVGTLSAELYHVVPGEGGAAPQEIPLNDGEEHPVFDMNTKWSPTTWQAQTLKVVNKGDLDFNYDLSLLLTGIDEDLGADQQAELLGSFDVMVMVEGEETELSADETGEWAGWTSLGTLAGFLKDASGDGNAFKEILLRSGMLKPNVTIENGAATPDSVDIIHVAIRMNDIEDLNLMGRSFAVCIKLFATQTVVGESAGE